jgi:hypothetical protein
LITHRLLAYTPFLDPLPLDGQWLLLLIPLAIAIALVYKTIKLPHLVQLPRQTAVLAAQILVFMVLAAAVIWLLSEIM